MKIKRSKNLKRGFSNILFMFFVVIITYNLTIKNSENYLKYYTSGNKSHYISPDIKIPKHNYDFNNLIDVNGKKEYYENGIKTSLFGIDVSQHQKDIDWQKVKNFGVDFAFIRVGYRGYEEGGLFLDNNFHQNMQGAIEAGIEVGVYFYSQALTVEEAREEAEFVLSNIKDYRFNYPVVYDWEYYTDKPNARTNDVDKSVLTDLCYVFCDTIQNSGYKVMYYGSPKFLNRDYDIGKLAKYDMWLAHYASLPRMIYDFKIWQYSEKGIVDGIEEPTDLNIAFYDFIKKEDN